MNRASRGIYSIIKNEGIAPGIFELCVEAPEIAREAAAGRFVNAYLPGGAMLLPRPLSIADAREDVLTLVYGVVGAGTKRLSCLAADGVLEAMGPLGTGFFDYPGSPTDASPAGAFKEEFEILLIGGGAGIPPLHFAARTLRAAFRGGVKIRAALGFREYPWYSKEFEHVCDEVLIASETEGSASFHGNVVELLEEAYQGMGREGLALACGPRPMLASASAWCGARGTPLRVSLEERMGCGYGACAGCTAGTRPLNDESKPQNGPAAADAAGIIKKKVCVHGPVFWADEVIWQRIEA